MNPSNECLAPPSSSTTQGCSLHQKVVRPSSCGGVGLGRMLYPAAAVVSYTLCVRKHLLQHKKKLGPASDPTSHLPSLQLTGAIRKLHVKLPLTTKTPWTTKSTTTVLLSRPARRVQIMELMTKRFKTPCDDEPEAVNPMT